MTMHKNTYKDIEYSYPIEFKNDLATVYGVDAERLMRHAIDQLEIGVNKFSLVDCETKVVDGKLSVSVRRDNLTRL